MLKSSHAANLHKANTETQIQPSREITGDKISREAIAGSAITSVICSDCCPDLYNYSPPEPPTPSPTPFCGLIKNNSSTLTSVHPSLFLFSPGLIFPRLSFLEKRASATSKQQLVVGPQKNVKKKHTGQRQHCVYSWQDRASILS